MQSQPIGWYEGALVYTKSSSLNVKQGAHSLTKVHSLNINEGTLVYTNS